MRSETPRAAAEVTVAAAAPPMILAPPLKAPPTDLLIAFTLEFVARSY